jgi:hypothetical protein
MQGKPAVHNRLVAAFVTMTPHPMRPDPGLEVCRATMTAFDPALQPGDLGLEAYLNASLAGLLLQKDAPQKDTQPAGTFMSQQLTALNGTRIGGMSVQFDPVRRQAVHWMGLSVVTRDGRVRSY